MTLLFVATLRPLWLKRIKPYYLRRDGAGVVRDTDHAALYDTPEAALAAAQKYAGDQFVRAAGGIYAPGVDSVTSTE